jgi:hypothetical protein
MSKAKEMLEKYTVDEAQINHPLLKRGEKLIEIIGDWSFKVERSKDFTSAEKKMAKDVHQKFAAVARKLRYK